MGIDNPTKGGFEAELSTSFLSRALRSCHNENANRQVNNYSLAIPDARTSQDWQYNRYQPERARSKASLGNFN